MASAKGGRVPEPGSPHRNGPDEGTLEVRDATGEDVPDLVDLLLRLDAHVAGVPRGELHLTDEGEAELQGRLGRFVTDPEKRLVVATTGAGRLVGMGAIYVWVEPEIWRNPERRGLKSGVIDDFWIEPSFRRRGVARRILAELVEFAARHGIEELLLEYSTSNAEANATWRRLGFRPVGIRAANSVTGLRSRLARTTGRRKR